MLKANLTNIGYIDEKEYDFDGNIVRSDDFVINEYGVGRVIVEGDGNNRVRREISFLLDGEVVNNKSRLKRAIFGRFLFEMRKLYQKYEQKYDLSVKSHIETISMKPSVFGYDSVPGNDEKEKTENYWQSLDAFKSFISARLHVINYAKKFLDCLNEAGKNENGECLEVKYGYKACTFLFRVEEGWLTGKVKIKSR